MYNCATNDQAQGPHAAVERQRLENHATQSTANHDCTGSHKKAPLYAGQTVSLINNDRTLWLPATVVQAADHGSYIVKVVGGDEYRRARDHICEHHPDAVKPDTSTKVEVAGQPSPLPQKLYSKHLLSTHSSSRTICCPCNTQASCIPKPYSSNQHPAEDIFDLHQLLKLHRVT